MVNFKGSLTLRNIETWQDIYTELKPPESSFQRNKQHLNPSFLHQVMAEKLKYGCTENLIRLRIIANPSKDYSHGFLACFQGKNKFQI